MGLEYSSSSGSHCDRGNPAKTRRERERDHTETGAIIKNSGVGVDRARAGVMVHEVESLLGCWLLAANNIEEFAKISLSVRISLFASSQISLTPQISLFFT